MQINGIDLGGLAHQEQALVIPEPVQGRMVHIDADFLAYQVSYEREGEGKSLEDMHHNARQSVAQLKALAGATLVHLHLTPASSNKGGRSEIAMLKEYQGNRKDKPKPPKLHIIREWLSKNFPATQHQLCEADDGMSSAQYAAIEEGNRNLSIIASKDKDLNMVPGLHLHWDTGEIIDAEPFGPVGLRERASGQKVLDGYGRRFFWAQMLAGDPADNTSGLPLAIRMAAPGKKVGPVLAADILKGCRNDRDAYETVRDLYKRYGQEVGFVNYRDGSPVTWGRAFLSEAQLVWMRVSKHNPLCVADYMQKVIA